jgi:hypothetical protein
MLLTDPTHKTSGWGGKVHHGSSGGSVSGSVSNPVDSSSVFLTFFKWAIDNEVITYALKHKTDIKKHMDINTQHRTNGKMINVTKQRKELSKGSKGANMYSVNLRVSFT